ncbi:MULTISPECIES: hypothetical protein [Weissella]|uniref:Uncharacterized protein n=1 Tax=Weissella thailandensis TaxID=89061 RepID=A0ABX9I4N2_9LACO|nr:MULTISPECIES: hypothetical protein [Weissella]NKY90833.1 hypothetical protein [Weissella thailandensis]RDS59661.1 hypothetical protein DWV05_04870 [Weissella thailandensis]
MPNDLIDPPDDEAPWGYDFEGDEIYLGDKIVEIDGEYIPLEKSETWIKKNGYKVNTEERQ